MKKTNFENIQAYKSEGSYHLLPFRFAEVPNSEKDILISNEVGEFFFTDRETLQKLVDGTLKEEDKSYNSFLGKHIISTESGLQTSQRLLSAKYRTKKSILKGGPALHIFVVTLRCDHSCPYCQVSRQNVGSASIYDMSQQDALSAIDILFSSPAQALTVEFQGGEPLLAFDKIKYITEEIVKRNHRENRAITFSITTTLHQINSEILSFFKEYNFQVSTSIDGDNELHNQNRPKKFHNSYAETIKNLEITRDAIGVENVAALTTLTKESLRQPEKIIDEYIKLGFKSIFLRPLSPYGFAVKTEKSIGYNNQDFLNFYTRAMNYIIELNQDGVLLEEAYTAILLSNILTPFSNGYVDLRSPTGSGLGVLVYNYDGKVYASDESRMLAEMGDDTFCLGNVNNSYAELMSSKAIEILLASGVSESTAGCSDCVFLPYCGSDPVFHYARYNDPVYHRSFSEHCERQTYIFNYIFKRLLENDPKVNRIFTAWVTRRAHTEMEAEG